MKSYILLRDNRESGPHTLRELKAKHLHPMDLIWVEGESTSWKYPTEIRELKSSVKRAEKNKPTRVKSYTGSTKKQEVVISETPLQKNPESPASKPSPDNDFYSSSYYEELK